MDCPCTNAPCVRKKAVHKVIASVRRRRFAHLCKLEWRTAHLHLLPTLLSSFHCLCTDELRLVLSQQLTMPLTPEKASAIAKKARKQYSPKPEEPLHLGKLDVIFTVAMAGVKMCWAVGTKKGQVHRDSPTDSPAFKWRAATKDLKDKDKIRAVSWHGEGQEWAAINGAGVSNALPLRHAFENPMNNPYNRKWGELMRDRSIINSITWKTTDGAKIDRATAFRLNDLVNMMPDEEPQEEAGPPIDPEDDTSLDV